MNGNTYDVVIIGGGVIGSSIARALSKYECRTVLLEKEEDVCSGTSKANSAIVHAGYDAKTGSLKAKLNVKGNAMMGDLSKELDFDFKRNSSLVLCFAQEDLPALQALYERGVANGVPDISILTGDEVRKMEPNVSGEVVAALYAPTGGIVCPFGLTIALAENACDNGVEFVFNTKAEKVEKTTEGYRVITNNGVFETKYVVNAAGVYSDEIHNMVSEKKLHIVPRRGEYCLLDKEAGNHVSATVFQLPGKYGKGILVSPTIHGNLLVGPTAVDQEDKDGTYTTAEGLAEACEKAAKSVNNIPFRQVITSFAGLRAHEDGHEFLIGELEDAKGFIDCAGIESPGLTSSPAIGVLVAGMLKDKLNLQEDPTFNGTRKGVTHLNSCTKEERDALIKENPAYGSIVCRCEMITEGEILDAIHRPLGATTLDGIKRRTRAGMGRCQAGFCSPRQIEILARELGVDQSEIRKSGRDSKFIVGTPKDRL